MRTGSILLLTDRPDRSVAVAEAARKVAECRTLAVTQPWRMSGDVRGIIADVELDTPQVRACLRWLKDEVERFPLARRPQLLVLAGDTASPVLRDARSLGATACLPRHSEPRAAVAALVRLVDPRETVTELIVRRGVSRTAKLLADMFRAAASGSLDMAAVEGALGPVLDAIEEGGLTRWLDVVWAYDDPTFQHCLLVAGITATFSQSLGLSRADQLVMARGALVHDIGKARVPLAILNKPGKLDSGEMAVMRTHAALGYDILKRTGECDGATLAMTRHHHEMLDGSGYPDGLSGDAIGDRIRLLSICDIYAALIERRPYKEPFTGAEAMRILQGMDGKLEGNLVHAFGKAVAKAHGDTKTAA